VNPGNSPVYDDVVSDILEFFKQRIAVCAAAGIPGEHLILDPGFGFGKALEHNLMLLARLERFGEPGLPLLVGISRKSMLGTILDGAPADDRLYASLAAAVMAAERGASIIRVHDVKPTADALKVVTAVKYVACD